jgi:hypothetical protein
MHPAAPALTCLLGAVVGIVAALLVHWFVVQPSDDELLAVAHTVVPSGFDLVGEPAISGAWAPSFTRGTAHVDATTWSRVTVDEVADELKGDGWDVEELDVSVPEGRTVGSRDGLVASVHLLPGPGDGKTRASVGVRRGPQQMSVVIPVAAGALVGAGLGGGAVITARRSAKG